MRGTINGGRAGVLAALMLAAASVPGGASSGPSPRNPLPKPGPAPSTPNDQPLTEADLARMAAAEAKRERRRARNDNDAVWGRIRRSPASQEGSQP